ncbi:MAG: hypothetical protein A2W93_14305 [Bacteroidetes bacterium GWF2_43_63]|nr:MAG: hypothetical protein A2W93_14305 [Bacteroidetes bacterium GWF2_43_63]HBG71420.1 hypothetical protein [Bacteroidales bacterium]HCB60828.1 hypothetical protein [Bacteroidales bacterium]
MYYIICTNKKGQTLFLANRKRFSKSWWTTKISLAMEYIYRHAAEKFIARLYLNNPRIIDGSEMKTILRKKQPSCTTL